ncbi:MAG TPA: RNA polymerase sigma factor [Candidatus Micrarchaeia archaeon]|nr:RNA polymerase sigma factor [Candidatus Micrarchaeia archaeon]
MSAATGAGEPERSPPASSDQRRRPAADAATVERWLEQYGDLALRTAYLVLGERPAAEDAVQEGFLRAWQARASLRDPGAERGWLLAIVANAARSQRRRRVAAPVDAEPVGIAAGPPLDPYDALDLAADLAAALRTLAPEHRAVIAYRIGLDCSVEETASILGVEPGTVKSRLHRALADLRGRWTTTTS